LFFVAKYEPIASLIPPFTSLLRNMFRSAPLRSVDGKRQLALNDAMLVFSGASNALPNAASRFAFGTIVHALIFFAPAATPPSPTRTASADAHATVKPQTLPLLILPSDRQRAQAFVIVARSVNAARPVVHTLRPGNGTQHSA